MYVLQRNPMKHSKSMAIPQQLPTWLLAQGEVGFLVISASVEHCDAELLALF